MIFCLLCVVLSLLEFFFNIFTMFLFVRFGFVLCEVLMFLLCFRCTEGARFVGWFFCVI